MRLYIVLLLLLSSSVNHLLAQDPILYLNKMVEAISKIKTLEYEMHAKELINSNMVYTHSRVKMEKSPFNFYNYIIKPNNGVEVLFTHNDKHALINPNGFPFVNLKLDPKGTLMRNKQHHTLFDAGFDNVKDIVLSFLDLLYESPEYYINGLRLDSIYDNTCYVLDITNPDFAYKRYVIKDEENIQDIAKRMNICAYHVLVKNNLNSYNDVDEGDEILISNSYGQSFEIWIDTISYLPIKQKIFINNKLFEHYEFQDVIVNPKFEENEFDRTFYEYNF